MIPDDVMISPRYPPSNQIRTSDYTDFRNASGKVEPSSASTSPSTSTRCTRPRSYLPPVALKTIRRRRRLKVSAKTLSLKKPFRGPKRKLFSVRRKNSGCDPETSRDTADRAVPSCVDGTDDRFVLAPMTSSAAAAASPPRPRSLLRPPRPCDVVCSAETRISTEQTVDRQRTTAAASHGLFNIPVPIDPRLWSRLDVRAYLDHARHLYDIRDLDPDRFPMNGKGLCVLSPEMFQFRVPSGGISLYLDFQRRFRRALELQ